MVQALFQRGYLRNYLAQRIQESVSFLERKPEDEVLSRSVDDLVEELVDRAQCLPLVIEGEALTGDISEESLPDSLGGGAFRHKVLGIHAVYKFEGEADLFYYEASSHLISTAPDSEVRDGTLTVHVPILGDTKPDAARQILEEVMNDVRTNAGYSTADVQEFNSSADAKLRPMVERRKAAIQNKRNVAGALGFPLNKRSDAPKTVPLQRKVLGVKRPAAGSARASYEDEWALTDAQYEDAIKMISSTMLSMERSPSVVAGMNEETLRDLILITLNGAFEGTATGETFVKKGKTDVLVRVEDRHVFVGECKWWTGEKALGGAVDQLLSYLPWRDEKAALIVFIKNKDASAVFDKVEGAVRAHDAFKRVGKSSADKTKRRNFVISPPEDSEREIKLAVLFAVLPQ